MGDLRALASGWFGTTPEAFQTELLAVGAVQHIAARTVLFEQGDPCRYLIGVASGTLRLLSSLSRSVPRVAHICGPGFWLGEHELITGAPRALGVDAPVDSEIVVVQREAFERLASTSPQAWRWLAHLSSQHMALAVGAAQDLMLERSECRMAAVILRLAALRFAHQDAPALRHLLVTQADLAGMANMSRRSAGDILRKFERLGWIEIGYGSIEIRDPKRLKAILA